LNGLQYLEKKGILHRDLKPENIMLTIEDGKPAQASNFRICDFGLATYDNVNDYLYKRCGTPGYVSPEIVKADADDDSFRATTKCDTFSAGVLLFLLLSKRCF
jgi:calcium/calmodulin-dependent protein kinase I